MEQTQFSHEFENGLVLLGEQMNWLESAAFAVLIPSGFTYESNEKLGISNFVCEMIQRGSGSRNSRQFVEDLERLGADRSATVSGAHSSFAAVCCRENLLATLSIYADLIRRPHLPADQLEEGRQVCFQELFSVEDDLAQKALQRLRLLQYGEPWGRGAQGTKESIQSITLEDIRSFFNDYYRPRGATISVAGNFNWNELVDFVGENFGDWEDKSLGRSDDLLPKHGYEHIQVDSSQTHIGVAFDSVPYRDKNYFQARGAVGVLSDGMSSRLFTEVREKRGLCYTVYASCHSLRERGSVIAYSGTSTDRAQETLDVLVSELKRAFKGIEEDELRRLKARIKSSLIMQQESSASRASSIAADWYHLRRIMTMEEIGGIIDGLTCDSINAYLAKNVPNRFTIVTLGEKELEVPSGVSCTHAG